MTGLPTDIQVFAVGSRGRLSFRMGASILNFSDWAGYILLIAVRVLSIFALNPIFGKIVPSVAKIVLGIMISYCVISTLNIQEPLVFDTTIEYVFACLKEAVLGITFSMIMYMMFASVYVAGNIIDIQLGFGFAQLYDANTGLQSNISSNILNIILIIMFFVSDAHHIMIRMLCETFERVPPGMVTLNASFVYLIIEVFVTSILLGLQIAIPIMAVSLIIEILLGVVIKSVPQMNFFIIGFPVKIIVGLAVLMLLFPMFVDLSEVIFRDMFLAVQKVFEEIGTTVP